VSILKTIQNNSRSRKMISLLIIVALWFFSTSQILACNSKLFDKGHEMTLSGNNSHHELTSLHHTNSVSSHISATVNAYESRCSMVNNSNACDKHACDCCYMAGSGIPISTVSLTLMPQKAYFKFLPSCKEDVTIVPTSPPPII